MSDIAERVKKIVVEHLGVEPEKVTEASNFIDDLGADSLDTVELVMATKLPASRLSDGQRFACRASRVAFPTGSACLSASITKRKGCTGTDVLRS